MGIRFHNWVAFGSTNVWGAPGAHFWLGNKSMNIIKRPPSNLRDFIFLTLLFISPLLTIFLFWKIYQAAYGEKIILSKQSLLLFYITLVAGISIYLGIQIADKDRRQKEEIFDSLADDTDYNREQKYRFGVEHGIIKNGIIVGTGRAGWFDRLINAWWIFGILGLLALFLLG